MDIPEGSRIDYLRLYFYDTSAPFDSLAVFAIYDGLGGQSPLSSVNSSGSGGYGTSLTGFMGHTVDYENLAYVLQWSPAIADLGMRLCGLRVAYRLPL
jgi:hypothetical protein